MLRAILLAVTPLGNGTSAQKHVSFNLRHTPVVLAHECVLSATDGPNLQSSAGHGCAAPSARARKNKTAVATRSTLAGRLISQRTGANGHGYMTEPPSRQFEAYEANGWPNEVAEYDPHGVAAGGMYAECDGCSSREWYAARTPGPPRHGAVDFVMGGAGGNIKNRRSRASPSRDNDYNQPDGPLGHEAKTPTRPAT